MSMFFCRQCGGFRDSDDGCEDLGTGLICAECVNDPELAEGSFQDRERTFQQPNEPDTRGEAPPITDRR